MISFFFLFFSPYMTDHLVTCFGQKPERYVLYLVWVAWFPSLGLGKKKKRKPTSARAWQMVTVSWQIIYLNSQTFSFYLWLLHLSFRSPFINKTDRILTVPILKSKCIHLFFTHKWVSDKWTDSDKTPKPRLQSNIWTITKSLYMSFLPGFF